MFINADIGGDYPRDASASSYLVCRLHLQYEMASQKQKRTESRLGVAENLLNKLVRHLGCIGVSIL